MLYKDSATLVAKQIAEEQADAEPAKVVVSSSMPLPKSLPFRHQYPYQIYPYIVRVGARPGAYRSPRG